MFIYGILSGIFIIVLMVAVALYIIRDGVYPVDEG